MLSYQVIILSFPLDSSSITNNPHRLSQVLSILQSPSTFWKGLLTPTLILSPLRCPKPKPREPVNILHDKVAVILRLLIADLKIRGSSLIIYVDPM